MTPAEKWELENRRDHSKSNGNGKPASCANEAIALLKQNFWPVVIKPGEKAPVGEDWGTNRPTEESIREIFGRFPDAGVGLLLGPDGGIVDFECDGPSGEESLAKLCGGKTPETVGWISARGPHYVFLYDARLAKYGKSIIKLPDVLPGLEIRIGATGKQIQSNCPPTVGSDGKPRKWNRHRDIASIPDAVFKFLDSALAKPKAKPQKSTCQPPADSYVVKALDDECNTVALAPDGERNSTLNTSSFALGQLVGAGVLSRQIAEERLLEAASGYVHTDGEQKAKATIRSGLDAGQREPRDLSHLHTNNGQTSRKSESPHGEAAAPPEINEAVDDPHRLARLFLAKHCEHDGKRTLVYHRDEFHRWCENAYRSMPDKELNATTARIAKQEFDRVNVEEVAAWEHRGRTNEKGKVCPKPVARKVGTRLTGDIALAVKGETLLSGTVEPPVWLCENPPFPASDVLPTSNVLVHLPSLVEGKTNSTYPVTPDYFCSYALDYAFDPNASHPEEWISFLLSVWPHDGESILLLQEWMGYLLTVDKRHHAIAMLIGPKRSGKGTIARTITRMVGKQNVAEPTIASLATHFGAQRLIGKPVAIIGDVRMSGHSDWVVALERLLGISGGDSPDIPRKNREDWSGELPTRFMMMANELPKFPDQAGALASRCLILRLTESFVGREDRNLDAKLTAEQPGILNWAIEGWKRLRERGRFLQPASGKELVDQMEDLGSPVGAFVREWCEVGSGFRVARKELYVAWKAWCEERGREPGSDDGFGRNLHAVLPHLVSSQPRDRAGIKYRAYEGIQLSPTTLS